ncbi:MAG: protein kinase [Acidobacteriota bacterium]
MNETKISREKSNFKILKELYKDQIGVVYRAIDRTTKKMVWLKILHKFLSRDKDYRTLFFHKARKAKILKHDNIQEVYAVWEEDGEIIVELEDITGTFLDKLVDSYPFEQERAIHIGYQILSALNYAHKKNVIHENIKPENIVLTRNDKIKIINFFEPNPVIGYKLSWEYTEVDPKKPYVSIVEEIKYFSPAHLDDKPIEFRSDLFSTGIVLYEMTSGVHPFKTESVFLFMFTAIYDDITHIENIKRDIYYEFGDLIMMLLERKKEKGYRSTEQAFSEMVPLYTELVKPYVERRKKKQYLTALVKKVAAYSLAAALIISFVIIPAVKKFYYKPQPTISIAVLPIDNATKNKEYNFMSIGLTDEIISSLFPVKNFAVRPLSTMLRYEEKKKDIQEIAKELKADVIVDGELKKEKDRIKLKTKIVKVKEGTPGLLWASELNLSEYNIPYIKYDIGRELIRTLDVDLSKKERGRMEKRMKVNPKAYEFYLKGKYYNAEFIKEIRKEYLDRSDEMLKKSLEIDKNYAPAYAALGRNAWFYLEYGIKSEEDLLKKGGEMSLKALEIDKDLIEAHTNLAAIYFKNGEKEKAYKQIEYVYKINPNNEFVIAMLGTIYEYAGLLDKALEKAEKLEKNNELNVLSYINRGRIYIYKNDFSKAKNELEKVFKIQNNHPIGLVYSGYLLFYEKKYNEAMSTLKESLKYNPEHKAPYFILSMIYSKQGKNKEAEKAIEEVMHLANYDGDFTYFVASYYSLQNDKQLALKWFKEAIKYGNENYPWFLVDPNLNNIRNEPEFKKIMENLKKRWEKYKKEFTL